MDLMNLFLQRRGYSPEYLADVNNSTNEKLLNIEKLTSILKNIHDNQDNIVIMPDFDCDGISAGTVGYAGLSQLGFNVNLYYPETKHGYGITVEDIDKVIQQFPHVKYIISCDVGITCYDSFFYAYQKGIKVLITDHHEELINKPIPKANVNNILAVGKPKLYAETIVDPCQLKDPYSLKGICGAHVFWQILREYADTYDQNNISKINMLRIFAGIGTIGDMMPLIHQNRILIKDTLKILKMIYEIPLDELKQMLQGSNSVYASSFLGLKEFLMAMDQEDLIYSSSNLDEKFLGWTMVPIYNAIKRMGYSTSIMFNIFFGQTPEIKWQNALIAISINKERKNSIKTFSKNLITSNQPFAPYIYLTTAQSGMLGLLANQLMRNSGLPTFVINNQDLTGSGRAPKYFPAITNLQNTEFHVAGHEEAFGIRFDDLNQIQRFYNLLSQYIPTLMKNTPITSTSDLTIASAATSSAIDGIFSSQDGLNFVNQSKTLKPFGIGFKEPKIEVLVNKNNSKISTMGRDNQHVKILLSNGTELIAWNKANKLDSLNDEFSFTGNFGINEFNHKKTLQMIGDIENGIR